MRTALWRLVDASGIAAIGLIARNWGYLDTSLVLFGVSIGLGLAIVWRALAEA